MFSLHFCLGWVGDPTDRLETRWKLKQGHFFDDVTSAHSTIFSMPRGLWKRKWAPSKTPANMLSFTNVMCENQSDRLSTTLSCDLTILMVDVVSSLLAVRPSSKICRAGRNSVSLAHSDSQILDSSAEMVGTGSRTGRGCGAESPGSSTTARRHLLSMSG